MAAAVARSVEVGVAQGGERVVVAGQERFRVFVDLEAGVGNQRAQLAFAQVGPGISSTADCLPPSLTAPHPAAPSAWEQGMTRGEAVSALAFATWDAAPAATAYTELEERAALFGVCLLSEEHL
jgi:hypothetical protein